MAFERTFYGRPPEGSDLSEQAKLGTVPADDPDLQAALLTRKPGQTVIGEDEVRKAQEILQEYKRGKANLERRVIEDELWYKLRHWQVIGKDKELATPKPASAWLFDAIRNKHADALDNYPEAVVLPREESDRDSAKILSSVLPVIFEQNDFESTYSDAWWEKLKHGCPVYGVFWNSRKENGLGDIDIRSIDLLNIFWEPGISDIQSSRNLFIVALEDNETLEQEYPQLRGKLGSKTLDVAEYLYDDDVDTSKKSVVVDWYYKVLGADGRTVLHFCKFVNDTILFASENNPEYAQTGWYSHGQYPVVLDPLFPEKGTPIGFGYVSICKEPQMYIDRLYANIIEKSLIDTKARYFVSKSTNVNKDQLLDVKQPFVDVEGDIDDTRLREITTTPISGVYVNILQQKIEEMKETAANRDVNSGGAVGGGVTAASAIAALQEAGNKSSRDMIKASYRAFTKIVTLVIELIRQFYDDGRMFRIAAPNTVQQIGDETGAQRPQQPNDGYQFVRLDNSRLREQQIGVSPEGTPLVRKPVFDLKVKAQKKNPFSRMEQNERAKELYGLGFYNPQNAQQALLALEMMDFEGIDQMKEKIMQGETLQKQVDALQALLQQTLGAIGMAQGAQPGAEVQAAPPAADGAARRSEGINGEIMQSQAQKLPYAEQLAKRSTPSVEG